MSITDSDQFIAILARILNEIQPAISQKSSRKPRHVRLKAFSLVDHLSLNQQFEFRFPACVQNGVHVPNSTGMTESAGIGTQADKLKRFHQCILHRCLDITAQVEPILQPICDAADAVDPSG